MKKGVAPATVTRDYNTRTSEPLRALVPSKQDNDKI